MIESNHPAGSIQQVTQVGNQEGLEYPGGDSTVSPGSLFQYLSVKRGEGSMF